MYIDESLVYSKAMEYNIEVNGKIHYWTWCTEEEMLRLWDSESFEQAKTELPDGWKFVKRTKAGEIEDV